MNYMGSKRQYAKYIVPIINKFIEDNNITIFIDATCGGAVLTEQIKCDKVVGMDLSPTLIALHKEAQLGFPHLAAQGGREEWDKYYAEYKRLKKDVDLADWEKESKYPLYDIGALEWYNSYTARGFAGGFATTKNGRNYFEERFNNHKKQAAGTSYKNIEFIQGSMFDLVCSNCCIYIDPPYINTKPYQICGKFDHNKYYDWARTIAWTNYVFCSEQTMPADFTPIWHMDNAMRTTRRDMQTKGSETLYYISDLLSWEDYINN